MNLRLLIIACLIAIAASAGLGQSSGGVSVGKGSHPVIKNKPEPAWPKSIKTEGSCTITLYAVFHKNGTVTNIKLVAVRQENTEHLLSEDDINKLVQRAVDAAKQIKFVPAMKDGRPVSMWMELQYTFNGKQKS